MVQIFMSLVMVLEIDSVMIESNHGSGHEPIRISSRMLVHGLGRGSSHELQNYSIL